MFSMGLRFVTLLLTGYFFWFSLFILSFRWIDPPFSRFSLRDNATNASVFKQDLRTQWVSLDELPSHLPLAVVASEDQRFYSHWGIDPDAIAQAIREYRQGKELRGASTITQQVAKNLFLSPSQSYRRKAVEAVIAVMIDALWSKERILEVYLNIAEFGPHIYGINKSAQYYYGKSATALDPVEAARMATVLPSPHRIEPIPASAYVKKRSRWILRNMSRLSGRSYLAEGSAAKKESSISNTLLSDDPADTVLVTRVKFNDR